MRITDVQAYPLSFRVPENEQVTLGIGRTVKRDTVVVKVETLDGLAGFGEAHHGRAPGSVAHLVNTTLRQLVMGMDATDVVGVWSRIYKMQLGSHGMGAACSMAMSGLDMALWDIRAKAAGWPLYRLLGGRAKAIPAYAGGIALGYQEPAELADEAAALTARGYRALKLRLGDSPARDVARVRAVRQALGPEVTILTDANTGYSLEDARRVLPALEECGVAWLEEPFPSHDYRSYARAASYSTVPLALGENTYTRFEFTRIIEDGVIDILQPDLSKTGGITEGLRIAALASSWKLPVHPHTSTTGINMAASIHFLCAVDNGGFFEADCSRANALRDELTTTPYEVGPDGCVQPREAPGIGVEIDEGFIAAHPVIEGPCYV
jgi:L-alanine-DL-glutamate epimerase-like enolase superfamily enzyme